MFEKVNPSHPDKLCDRIGGAIVDLAYKKNENPKVAGECLLGHGDCHIIIETNVNFEKKEIEEIVHRIAGKNVNVDLKVVPQDTHLAENQDEEIRCGDNGIFKGVKVSFEEAKLTYVAKNIYKLYPYDGKFIIDGNLITACQSNIKNEQLETLLELAGFGVAICNPLGEWTGGPDVDTGACNRKLGSDMGRAATGGGLHFKDISKADVSINVYLHYLANETRVVEIPNSHFEASCSIGDTEVEIKLMSNSGKEIKSFEKTYKEITDKAMAYIKEIGGFEKLAEWGLAVPNSTHRISKALNII